MLDYHVNIIILLCGLVYDCHGVKHNKLSSYTLFLNKSTSRFHVLYRRQSILPLQRFISNTAIYTLNLINICFSFVAYECIDY